MHDGCKTHSELMGPVERKWNPYGRVPCKDGWLVWSAENNFSWEGTTTLESKKKIPEQVVKRATALTLQ